MSPMKKLATEIVLLVEGTQEKMQDCKSNSGYQYQLGKCTAFLVVIEMVKKIQQEEESWKW